jgi:glycosyltransferase involved in cell wall biosynthesis
MTAKENPQFAGHSPRGPQQGSTAAPLRILHIIADLSLAGAEMKLYKLLTTSDRQRFAHTVLSMRDGGGLRAQIEALGIAVHSLGIRGSLPHPASIRTLARVVRKIEPQVIHGWMYHGNLAAQAAAVLSRNKPGVLWSIHQSLYSFAYEKRLTALVIRLGARLSRLPEKIVYVSRTSAAQHESAGYSAAQSLVVPYGFDTEKFAPSEQAREALRRELGLTKDALLIGLVGRYHPVKDHANFLHAAAQIVKRRPDVRFVLCGRGVDQSNANLAQLIKRLGLEPQVYLLGERSEIQTIIAAFDLAVSSSYSEGFPNVVGEAMSCAVPCVVTEVSDLPDVVGKTCPVVPARDSAALAAAIAELINAGPDYRRALGNAARARIIERFTLEKSVARYEAVYESLIDAQTGTRQDVLLSGAGAVDL